jgi:hypothetical protein
VIALLLVALIALLAGIWVGWSIASMASPLEESE